MAVADGLLAGRFGVDVVQRQRHLYELLTVGQPFYSTSLVVYSRNAASGYAGAWDLGRMLSSAAPMRSFSTSSS